MEGGEMKDNTVMERYVMQVGAEVEKVVGYKWPGVVVAVFKTLSGETRVVVECTVPEVRGALHIYNESQLIVVVKEGK
jgi:hypothetical protein